MDGVETIQRIVKSVFASDIEGSLNVIWWIMKRTFTIAPTISGSRPRATEHTILELVTRWTGLVRPSVVHRG